jgi:hypothetical protein
MAAEVEPSPKIHKYFVALFVPVEALTKLTSPAEAPLVKVKLAAHDGLGVLVKRIVSQRVQGVVEPGSVNVPQMR